MARTRTPATRTTSATSSATSAPAAPSRAWLDLRGPFVLPLLALLVTRMWMSSRMPYASEDAYITFRYAWNLAHGAGAVFNPGEHVYGFTSAPWMTWLALGLGLGQDPALWSRVSLVLADVVTLFAASSLLERHASRTGAWCFAVMFALWPYCAALSMTGLEMSAFIALLALSAWLIDRKHSAAGVALGLLAVFRPEGLLAAGALAWWASRRDRWVALGLVVAVLGALTLYYGSPIPHSVRAKAVTYGAPGPLHSLAWWDWTLPMSLSNRLGVTSEGANMVMYSLIASPAALAGAFFLWKERRRALAGTVLAAGAVWLSYIAVGASYFFWYLATPLFAWMLLVACGLPRIATGRWLYAAGTLALLGAWIYQPYLYINRSLSEQGLFSGAGDFIAGNVAPGATVMLEPLGIIGWHAREQRFIDEVGLVAPAVTTRRAAGAGWYADVLRDQRPDWLLVRASLLSRGTALAGTGAPFRSEAERTSAMAAYQVIAKGDSVSGDQNLIILKRIAQPSP